jgi:phospholipase C
VRVPAVIVSPHIKAGTVIRPPDGCPNPFDHTSIIATLRGLWSLGGPLTGRDAAAPDLLHALACDDPNPDWNDGPQKIAPPDGGPSPTEVSAAAQLPPNDHQAGLCTLAAHLPSASTAVDGHLAAIEQQIVAPAAPAFTAAEQAGRYVEARMKAFIGSI